MNSEWARRVFQILVEEVGAYNNEAGDQLADFIYHQEDECTEYRFGGMLGFGGKFWSDRVWRVTCYPEDRTPEREAAMARANVRLAALHAECGCGETR